MEKIQDTYEMIKDRIKAIKGHIFLVDSHEFTFLTNKDHDFGFSEIDYTKLPYIPIIMNELYEEEFLTQNGECTTFVPEYFLFNGSPIVSKYNVQLIIRKDMNGMANLSTYFRENEEYVEDESVIDICHLVKWHNDNTIMMLKTDKNEEILGYFKSHQDELFRLTNHICNVQETLGNIKSYIK